VQKFVRYIVAIAIVLVLLSFVCTYTVRFTERAVVTTFGKATEQNVKLEPGLNFKWPPPIQSVTKYDSRVRLFTLKVETQQTKDNRQVAVETFCTWRVSDPLKFFKTFASGERAEEHYKKAEEALRANLRAATGVVSQYTMEDLFTTQSGQSKLLELEARMLGTFREARAENSAGEVSTRRLADYGIEAVDVGLTRILLPEEVTKAVFERMKSSRSRIAKEIESQGQSQAQTIRAKATSDADRIRSFANTLAESIRTEGEREASAYLAQMNSNVQLAVFLEKTKFLREMNPRTATLVLSTDLPGLDLLTPGVFSGVSEGQVPGNNGWIDQVMRQRGAGGGAAGGASQGVRPNAAADIRTPEQTQQGGPR
jgi:modulator of FtsH protease HflC